MSGNAVLKVGDVFAVPLPTGEYAFGRIMLDLLAANEAQLFRPDSPLAGGLGRSVLVEMYDSTSRSLEFSTSNTLIPGALMQRDAFGSTWPMIDHQPVKPQFVEFPENLVGYMHDNGAAAFICGEMRIPIRLSYQELDEIGIYGTAHSSYFWPAICLDQFGRENDIPNEFVDRERLSSHDLRFSTSRDRIYDLLPIDQSQTYFQQQTKLGFNLSRLYL